jgi:hypothetical protein
LAGTRQDQIIAYTAFVRNFGTHFIRRAKYGASMSYMKVFSSVSDTTTITNKRKECLVGTAASCRSAGQDAAGVSGSQKNCINAELDKCLETTDKNVNAFENSFSSVRIITRGSKAVGDIRDWAKEDGFVPVPISMEVDSIVNLITDRNVAKDPGYGFPGDMDASALRQFFATNEALYCQKYLELSKEVCQEQLTGDCGP